MDDRIEDVPDRPPSGADRAAWRQYLSVRMGNELFEQLRDLRDRDDLEFQYPDDDREPDGERQRLAPRSLARVPPVPTPAQRRARPRS